MHSIAESIDHIEDRIRVWDVLPKGRKHLHRVEDSSEIGKWSEEKVRNDRDRVEAICEDAIQESYEREEEWCEECEEDREPDMSEGDVREEKCDSEYDRTCHHTTDDSPCDEAEDHYPVWSRWHEDLFDRLLELRHIERWYDMRERVHDDRHHDESWDDELHIVHTSDFPDTRSDKLPEYDIVERRRDDRRDDRLFPHAEETSDFLSDDGHIGSEQCRRIHVKECRK